MVVWGDDIGKLDQGKYYKIESPFWSTYKEETQLSLGKYFKLHLADVADLIPVDETTPTTNSVPEPPPGYHSDGKGHWIKNDTTDTTQSKIPTIPDTLKDFVINEDDFLLQIEEVIEENHKSHGLAVNGLRTGMHAKEIYKEAKKTNLTKASDIK